MTWPRSTSLLRRDRRKERPSGERSAPTRSHVSRSPATYRERTYGSPHWLVRYPHQRRMAIAVDAVIAEAPQVVLDYGAGDGELVEQLVASGGVEHVEVIALEPLPEMNRSITERLAALPGEHQVRVVDSVGSLGGRSVDVITCLGVLEHLPLPGRYQFYADVHRLLRDGGLVLVDVPVEVGLSLLIKDLGRRLLKGDVREYSAREMVALVLGRTAWDPGRYDPSASEGFIVRHRGFDHRLLRRELETQFRIERVIRSPVAALPASLGNQEVFYACRRLVGELRDVQGHATQFQKPASEPWQSGILAWVSRVEGLACAVLRALGHGGDRTRRRRGREP